MSLCREIFQKRASYVVGCNHGFDLGEAYTVYNPVNGSRDEIGGLFRHRHKARLSPKQPYIAVDHGFVGATPANWESDHPDRPAIG